MSNKLNYLLGQIQTGDSFESDRMITFPLVGGMLDNRKETIDDISVYGVSYPPIPRKAYSLVVGNFILNVDSLTLNELLFGVSYLNNSMAKYSFYFYRSGTLYEISSAMINSFKLVGQSNKLLKIHLGVVAQAMESSVFSPTISYFSELCKFSDTTFLISDCEDALDSSDEVELLNFEWSITNSIHVGFDTSGVLSPQFMDTKSEIKLVTRHNSSNFSDWLDALTPLQMSLEVSSFDIEFPRLAITSDSIDQTSLNKQTVFLFSGRNGIDGHYLNPYMETNDFVRSSSSIYMWNMGNGVILFGQTVGYAYPTGGEYVVTLTAFLNGEYCARKCRVLVTEVNELTYEWDMGDGSDSLTGNSVGHVYSEVGVSIAAITAIEKGIGVDTRRVHIDVNGHNLTNTWDFGDGSPIEVGNEVEHSYSNSGTYSPELDQEDGYGDSDNETKTNHITVS